MAIVHRLLADGGFVAGDQATGLTGYAYPTSTNATRGKRDPEGAAADVMRHQFVGSYQRADYDRRNWALLNGRVSR